MKNIDKLEYDLTSIIRRKCQNFEIIDYEGISHSEIVSKALKLKKPFSLEKKGYRDTLIWLSLLKYIKTIDYKGEVAFITKNNSDFFFKSKNKVELHPDLVEDIYKYEINIKITPYESLFSFINENINEDKNIVNHEEIVENVVDILEEESVKYFCDISRKELNSVLSMSHYHNFLIDNLLSLEVEIVEGLEDETLMNSKKVNKDMALLTFSYNLRQVVLKIEISKDEYEKNKNIINKTSINDESTGDTVIFEILVRPYFNISFIYELEKGSYDNVSINCINLR